MPINSDGIGFCFILHWDIYRILFPPLLHSTVLMSFSGLVYFYPEKEWKVDYRLSVKFFSLHDHMKFRQKYKPKAWFPKFFEILSHRWSYSIGDLDRIHIYKFTPWFLMKISLHQGGVLTYTAKGKWLDPVWTVKSTMLFSETIKGDFDES